MKVLAVLALAAATVAFANPASAGPKRPVAAATPAKAPLSALAEAQQYIQASRAIEAATSSGVNVRDYSRLVSELSAATTALDEELEARGEKEVRRQITLALDRYQRAKDFWSACIGDSGVTHGFVHLSMDTLASAYAKQLLVDFPEMNRPSKEGGVLDKLSDSATVYGMAYQPAMLSKLWDEAGAASKSARQSLR